MGRLAGRASRIRDRELGGRLEQLRASTAPADIAPTSAPTLGDAYISTLVTLSAGQAAGTSPVLAANTARTGLVIAPVAACPPAAELGLAAFTGANQGVAMATRPDWRWEGARVPTNAVYVRGFTAGDKVLVWEA